MSRTHWSFKTILSVTLFGAATAFASPGSIWTTYPDGTIVNGNVYDAKDHVYLNGGPQNAGGKGIPDGIYYYHVVDPSGAVELSQDALACRKVRVTNGVIAGPEPSGGVECSHPAGALNPANGSRGVKLMPYADTPNTGGEYKVEITPVESYGTCGDKFGFCDKKSDNFKVALPNVAYVTACKFNDFNRNGVQDSGEETLAHWPISATGVDGGPVNTSTDDFGCVSFNVSTFPGTSGGSPAASITLREGTLGVNWVQTAPADGARARVGTTPAYTVTGGVVTTTDLRPGDILEIDFGNHNPDCNETGECGTDNGHGALGVFKDVKPSYKITWGLSKSVDKSEFITSGSAQPNYTLTVTHDAGTGFVANGTIRLTNPSIFDVTATSVTDAVDNGGSCSVTGGTNVFVAAGEHVDLAYSCTYTSLPAAGTNTVTANWTDGTYSSSSTFSAAVDFANAQVIDGTVTVSDPMMGDPVSVSYTDPASKTITYSPTLNGTPGTCVTKDNTATLASAMQGTTMEPLSDSKSVKICVGANPTVSKTAAASFKRSYAWKIEKSVDRSSANIANGGTAPFNYKVTATQTGVSDSDWKVTGTITVTNNNDFEAMTVSLADSLPSASCSIDGSSSVTVPKGIGQTASANYTCTFASQPAEGDLTNTATATWTAATYGTPGSSASGTATAAFGAPTTTVDKVISVKDVWNGGAPQDFGTLTGTESAPFTTKDFTYQQAPAGVAGTCTDYTNTASFTSNDSATTGSASKTVKVCVGKDLTVSKTVSASFARNYTWAITKTADQTRVNTAASSTTFTYAIKASQTGFTDSGWSAVGTITVSNPNNWEAVTVSLSDAVNNGGACTIDGGGSSFSVPASGTVTKNYTCSYASAPSAASFTNTATITWDNAAAATPTGSASGTASGNFNTPATTTNKTITVTDTFTGGSPATLGTLTATDAAPYASTTFPDAKTVSGTAGTCTTYNNTAAFTGSNGASGSASASVMLCVAKDLVVSKSATPSFTRAYSWGIAKSVDRNFLILGGTVNYTVTVSETAVADSGWAVTGTITVSNPNDWESVGFNLADAISNGGNCSVTGGTGLTLAAGGSLTANYSCTYSSQPAASFVNTATASVTSGITPNGSASGTASGAFSTPTNRVNGTITVTDTMAGTLGTVSASDTLPYGQNFTYSRTIPAPVDGCSTVNNIARIVETGASASAAVSSCGLGERTIGYWQNKNGQGVIGGADQAALGAWLRQFHAFSDAPSSNVGGYVTKIIKAASCNGPSCNTMLRAQMLGTALSVYFTDPALGGNVFNTAIPVGSALISLVNPENVSGAFGGATSMTIMNMLLYQNTADPAADAGASWYGQNKNLQTLAKDAFDNINNGKEQGP